MNKQRRSDRLVPFKDLLWFFNCKVDSAGPGEDYVTWVQLTCADDFAGEWFTSLPMISQQVLDTALVALQSNLLCTVAVTSVGGEIYRIQPVAGEASTPVQA
jgi:hypothetical protein